MNRLRFLLLAAVCPIVPASTVCSAPVPAARSGLEQVPATAPVVIHVRGVQGVHERLAALMKQALPDVLKKYQKEIDEFFEKGPEDILKNRKLDGLAKDGPIFIALLELPKDNGVPKLAIILAVSNYKEFRDNILTEEERKSVKDEGNGIESANIGSSAKTAYFVDRKGYAVVTPDKEAAESFTKKIGGLHKKINKELAAKLLASDAGVYVNMDAVIEEYGEQIKQIKSAAEQALGFATASVDESQKKYAEMLKNAVPHIFQTIEDMKSLLLTVEMRSAGLALNLQSEMKESSTTAKHLQDARPIPFKELEHLPRDLAYYLGMRGSVALNEILGSLITGLPAGESKDSAKLMKELAKAGPNLLLGSFSIPERGLIVYQYDDPAKAVAATLTMYQNLDFAVEKLKKKPDIKPDAEKFGDFKLHSVQLTMDLEKIAAAAAAQGGDDAKKQSIEALKNIIGEKKTIWFGTDGKTVVQITAPDWNAAKKLLEQYSKSAGTAGEVQAFHDVRKELPAQTSFLALVDALHLSGKIAEAVKPIIPAGQVPEGWPKVPAKSVPAYLGLAVTLQPQRGGFDLYVTAAAAKDFYRAIVQPLIAE